MSYLRIFSSALFDNVHNVKNVNDKKNAEKVFDCDKCEKINESQKVLCASENNTNKQMLNHPEVNIGGGGGGGGGVISHSKQSIAVPEGLAMDPLAPTALAVSSEFMERIGTGLTLLRDHGKKVQQYLLKNRKLDVVKKSCRSMVNIVLVEAKNLPDGPDTGSNLLYCKFRLGSELHKSKQVSKCKAAWRERFNLHLYDETNLEITVWHKGRQKNFMGRCIIDLSQLEKEKTHELWQNLECGYGQLHLLVTVGATTRNLPLDNVPTTNGIRHISPAEEKYTWYRLQNWDEVGQLSVTVHCARGLSPTLGTCSDAYCVLELDNSRVQTHTVTCTTEPKWNKSFVFDVTDITSTLDIAVYDETILTSKGETLGKVSIPLLRINNGERRWYGLKDRNRKSSARGNCPRILLEMSVVWNPVKASVRVLSPKTTKYTQKPPKFDIPLIYSNLKFVKEIFSFIQLGNEHYKRLFEWESQELSALALIAWLGFWYLFRFWMTPLVLMIPFFYHWKGRQTCNQSTSIVPYYTSDDEFSADEDLDSQKDVMTIKNRLYGLQDLTFTIKNSIDYIVTVVERIKNLVNFTVPYLSFLALIVLAVATIAFYVIPVNYLFMALGIYKFIRKFLNPNRTPNNDLLDFISRLPDKETLKQWRELKVPEPNVSRSSSVKK